MKYAVIYDKNQYSLQEACLEFMSMYVLSDAYETVLEYIDVIGFIKGNKYLILEDGPNNVVILSDYDIEDFDFIKGA